MQEGHAWLVPFPRLPLLQANLTKSQNEFKIVLKELEDSLLARLSAASGNFLGDTTLVENLETTKHTANEIEEKVSCPGVSARAHGVGSWAEKGHRWPQCPSHLPKAPPRTASKSAKGLGQAGGAHLLTCVVHLLVSLKPILFVLRCKRQKSQSLKSMRQERTTGQLRRGRPCCISF